MYFEYDVRFRSFITVFWFIFLCRCSVIVAVLTDGEGDRFIECGLVFICVLDSCVFDHGVVVGRI